MKVRDLIAQLTSMVKTCNKEATISVISEDGRSMFDISSVLFEASPENEMYHIFIGVK